MDFKNWKISKSDGKKAVLTHKDGHFMTIAIKALSRIQQQQIKRLASGGLIKSLVEEEAPENAKWTSARTSEIKKGVESSKTRMAKGGNVHGSYGDGGTSKAGLLTRSNQPGDKELAKQDHRAVLKGLKNDNKDRKYLDKGGQVETPETPPVDIPGAGRMYYDEGSGDVQDYEAAGQPEQPAQPAGMQVPSAAGATIAPDRALNPVAALQLEQQAAGEQAQVDASKAQQMLPAQQHALKELQQQKQELIMNAYRDMKKHTDDFAKVQSEREINPRAYTDGMDSHKRTMTSIGLILGGMGSGLTGGPNVAADYLNKQIDRDIDAQKTNSNMRHTVWGAYNQLYKDSQVASQLAKVSTLDRVSKMADVVAAKLGTPQAMANKHKLQAELAFQRGPALQDAAGRMATLQLGQKLGNATSPEGQPQEGQATMPGDLAPSAPDSLLQPGHEKDYQGVMYKPQAKGHEGEIQKQYSQAVQADKALKQLEGLYPKLVDEAKEGGLSGRIHRSDGHSLAAIGGAAGAAAGTAMAPGLGTVGLGTAGAAAGEALGKGIHSLTGTDVNRAYDSDKTALIGFVSSALKGTNIGSDQIQEVVNANAPDPRDPPSLSKQKLMNIKDFIKNHTETSALDAFGLTKPR